jgi:hypothetical protein
MTKPLEGWDEEQRDQVLCDLPQSKARSVLEPLESGLLELLKVLGYTIDGGASRTHARA